MFKKIATVAAMLIVFLAAGVARSTAVPRYFNYQAVLYDSGGNPLPDGKTRISARILDETFGVLYEEEHEAEVVSGFVSMMIGDGNVPGSATPTGGISQELLLPEGARYLEVQAYGYPSEGPMELVSVPYCSYSEVALNVADGAVGSTQIKKGAINVEHFSDGLISELAGKMADGDGGTTLVVSQEFNDYKDSISGMDGAKQIGVTPQFNYSSGSTLQNVLADFDLAIKKRSEDAKIVGDIAKSHINSMTNPHQVTSDQVGAVAKSYLLDANGIVKDIILPPYLAQPQITLNDAGHGRIAVIGGKWKIDEENTNIDCSLNEPPADWSVECTLKDTSVDCNQFSICSINDEFFPTFDLYSKNYSFLGGAATVPQKFERWVETYRKSVGGSEQCGCVEKVKFETDNISGYLEGSFINWHFYRRQLNI